MKYCVVKFYKCTDLIHVEKIAEFNRLRDAGEFAEFKNLRFGFYEMKRKDKGYFACVNKLECIQDALKIILD